MTNKEEEEWRELCRRASQEYDSTKLLELVQELSEKLDQRLLRPYKFKDNKETLEQEE